MKDELLRINNGILNIDGNEILKSIYVQVFKEETIGVIFDDTKEKEAFISVLSGERKLSYGKIYFNEEKINELDSVKVIKKNISVINKTSKLNRNLSIEENIYFAEFGDFYIDYKLFKKKTLELFGQFQINIPINQEISKMTHLECIMIELLKGFALKCSVVVLTDLNCFLDDLEINIILSLIKKLKQYGMSFIMIDTLDDIIFEQTDHLMVIKKGRTIGSFKCNRPNREKIFKIIFEEQMNLEFENIRNKNSQYIKTKEIILSFDQVTTEVLHNVSFEIRRGEIVTLLYRDDRSEQHLLGLLTGGINPSGGNVFINEKSYQMSGLLKTQKKGLCIVEENPIDNMLFHKMSVMDNLYFPLCNKVQGLWLKSKYKKSIIKSMENIIDKQLLRSKISELPPSVLQKIIYCKWFLYAPNLVVCIKPFSSSDLQVNQVTKQMVSLLSDRGIAVLILTSKVPAFNALEGKIVYLKDGKLVNNE